MYIYKDLIIFERDRITTCNYVMVYSLMKNSQNYSNETNFVRCTKILIDVKSFFENKI